MNEHHAAYPDPEYSIVASSGANAKPASVPNSGTDDKSGRLPSPEDQTLARRPRSVRLTQGTALGNSRANHPERASTLRWASETDRSNDQRQIIGFILSPSRNGVNRPKTEGWIGPARVI